MKDLITTIASILIFSLFLMQYVTNIRTYSRIMEAESNIRIISLEGSKTYDSDEKIENYLNDKLKWNNDRILANKVKTSSKYDNYDIQIVIPDVISGMGKKSKDDSFIYKTSCLIKKEIDEYEEPNNNAGISSDDDAVK